MHPHRKFLFEDIFCGLTADHFFSYYWEQQVGYFTAKKSSLADISKLISEAEIFTYLEKSRLEWGEVLVANSKDADVQKVVSSDTPLNPHKLYSAWTNGSTIIVNGADQRFSAVSDITACIEASLGCRVRCNLYCTPAHSQGFGPHQDNHDVLILQIKGRKAFDFYEENSELMLNGQDLPFREAFGKKTYSKNLAVGESLYIPRGVTHDAKTSNDLSVHLTFGLYGPQIDSVLSAISESAALKGGRLCRTMVPSTLFGSEVGVQQIKSLLQSIVDDEQLLYDALRRLQADEVAQLSKRVYSLSTEGTNLVRSGMRTFFDPREESSIVFSAGGILISSSADEINVLQRLLSLQEGEPVNRDMLEQCEAFGIVENLVKVGILMELTEETGA